MTDSRKQKACDGMMDIAVNCKGIIIAIIQTHGSWLFSLQWDDFLMHNFQQEYYLSKMNNKIKNLCTYQKFTMTLFLQLFYRLHTCPWKT